MIGRSENQLGCKVIDTVGVFECDRYVKSTGSEAFRTKRVIILPVFKHSVSAGRHLKNTLYSPLVSYCICTDLNLIRWALCSFFSFPEVRPSHCVNLKHPLSVCGGSLMFVQSGFLLAAFTEESKGQVEERNLLDRNYASTSSIWLSPEFSSHVTLLTAERAYGSFGTKWRDFKMQTQTVSQTELSINNLKEDHQRKAPVCDSRLKSQHNRPEYMIHR